MFSKNVLLTSQATFTFLLNTSYDVTKDTHKTKGRHHDYFTIAVECLGSEIGYPGTPQQL